MVSKIQWENEKGVEGVSLMDYTKEQRWQITYNNLGKGAFVAVQGEKVCAHIKVAAVFQCSASDCSKAHS